MIGQRGQTGPERTASTPSTSAFSDEKGASIAQNRAVILGMLLTLPCIAAFFIINLRESLATATSADMSDAAFAYGL